MRLDLYIHTDQAVLASMAASVARLVTQGEVLMGTQQDLQTMVDTLMKAQAAEQQRQEAQDAATEGQLVVLQQAVTDLQAAVAAGSTVPDTVLAQLQSVIDSLNAEKPTPPAPV